MRTVHLKQGFPTLDEARRRLLRELAQAEAQGIRLLKVVHGWGSNGEGGVLSIGIRKSLRLRVKEGRALALIPGERFATDTAEAREVLARHPSLRRDVDFNRGNPGITILELAPSSRPRSDASLRPPTI
ncbi:MAG: Smr/MutS family protein [Verrucomicrobiales bacterium]|nr:Smr/MutS family protein [Verrucomicrobiales bacterium]